MSYQDLTPGQWEWVNLINQNFHSQSRFRKDRNMSVNTISAGQKGWVDILNQNFTEIGKPTEKVNLTFLNGWSPVSEENCYAEKIPLPNGTTLKIISVAIRNASVPAGANYDPLVVIPSGFESSIPQPIGKVFDVGVSGHFQGTINWFFSSKGLGANYNPINGEMGPYDITIWTTILYI